MSKTAARVISLPKREIIHEVDDRTKVLGALFDIFPPNEAIRYFLQRLLTWEDIKTHLNRKNQNRILKAIHTHPGKSS